MKLILHLCSIHKSDKMLDFKEYWEKLSSVEKLKFVLKIIFGLIAILFAVFNWQTLELHLVFGKVYLPLTILIFICFIVGFFLSSLFDFRRFNKKNIEIERLERQIEKLKAKEIEEKK